MKLKDNEIIQDALRHSDLSEFRFINIVISGDECSLVNPIAFPKYNTYNKYLRSVIYRKSDYKIISAGFPKFTNWLEKPDIFPIPTQISECQILTKLDGSLLCISKYKSEFIIRTRGSCNVDKCFNKNEIDFFKLKYYKFFDSILDGYTYLTEWVSPLQRIVLNYNEPDIYLIGVIDNTNYSLIQQDKLDILACDMGIQRPESHSFISFNDLFKSLENKKNFEGYCIYSNNGQSIHKVKTEDYLIKHRFKSNLNYENMVDYFLIRTDLSIETILDDIEREVDFECATQARIFLKEISDRYNRLRLLIDSMRKELALVKDGSRKELALFIQRRYNATERRLAFQVADGKEIDIKLITNILNERTI